MASRYLISTSESGKKSQLTARDEAAYTLTLDIILSSNPDYIDAPGDYSLK